MRTSLLLAFGISAVTGSVFAADGGGCGDKVCSAGEKANRASCPIDCVSVSDSLSSELGAILQRTDNKKYPVSSYYRRRSISKALKFADALGLNVSGISKTAEGRQTAIAKSGENVSAFLSLELGTEEGDDEEIFVARKAWILRSGSKALDGASVLNVANAALTSYGLPNLRNGDTLTAGRPLQARSVENGTRKVLQQVQPYYRSFGGRPVINSAIKVEVDNASSKATGLVVSNWWPVGSAKSVTLKSAAQLKADVLAAVARNVGARYEVAIRRCYATFYQLNTYVIPTATCHAKATYREPGSNETEKEPIVVTVSVTSDFKTAEETPWAVPSGEEGEDEATANAAQKLREGKLGKNTKLADLKFRKYEDSPSKKARKTTGRTPASGVGAGDDGVGSYRVLWSEDLEQFYEGCDKFHQKFDRWSGSIAQALSSRFLDTGTSSSYLDEADLGYICTHGGVGSATADDATVYLNDASSAVPELGVSDMEYLIHTGCLAASAVYCSGKSATSRYTASSSRNSAFNGLRILGSNHGVKIGSNSINRGIGKRFANYLEDGLSVIEAWSDAENDSDSHYNNLEDGCDKIASPASNCSRTDFTCDRWGRYPAALYLDGHKRESLGTSGSYHDSAPGDSDYDVDLFYYTDEDEQVPIYSVGYDLP